MKCPDNSPNWLFDVYLVNRLPFFLVCKDNNYDYGSVRVLGPFLGLFFFYITFDLLLSESYLSPSFATDNQTPAPCHTIL